MAFNIWKITLSKHAAGNCYSRNFGSLVTCKSPFPSSEDSHTLKLFPWLFIKVHHCLLGRTKLSGKTAARHNYLSHFARRDRSQVSYHTSVARRKPRCLGTGPSGNVTFIAWGSCPSGHMQGPRWAWLSLPPFA